jgi:histidyl-tRNA synthetase
VLIALADEGVEPPSEPAVAVYVVTLGAAAREAGAALVTRLRAAGLPADTTYEERPMKAQLKQADHAAARFAAILGEDELSAGTVTLRRMADGAQEAVPVDDVAARVAAEVGS